MQSINIPTSDNKTIYTTLDSVHSDKLIIFIHGLTGHINEHIYFNGVPFFNNDGYDTLRVSLYSYEQDARKLQECTIKTHTNDLNTVIDHMQKSYKKIYLVGHSFGGPTIYPCNKEKVDAIALWDPSIDKTEDRDDLDATTLKDQIIIRWEISVLMNKEMKTEMEHFGPHLLKGLTKPTKVICAGNGILHKLWKTYISKIPAQSQLHIIPDADHCFNSQKTEQELFEQTRDWFNQL